MHSYEEWEMRGITICLPEGLLQLERSNAVVIFGDKHFLTLQHCVQDIHVLCDID